MLYNIDCIVGMKQYIDNEAIDLIIADPPYFKVINEKWDYIWRTEDDYLNWSEKWIDEFSKVLRKGGSLYLFGYFKMLCKLLPLLEKYGFELRQQIIINKGIRTITGRATKNYKMFPNVTESILFLYKDNKPFVKQFLKERQKTLGLTSKEINEALGVRSNGGGMWSIYTGKNISKQFPTKEMWNKLENILDFSYSYDKLSQTYNTQLGITDVWDDIDFYKDKNKIHPTQKPKKLIERLILTSSNEKDIILDPFAGSGIVYKVCNQLNRNYIGFEINKEYFNKGYKNDE